MLLPLSQKMQSSLACFVEEKTGFKLLDDSKEDVCEPDARLPSSIPRIDSSRWEAQQADVDSTKPAYEEKYDDYLEIWAQFGYAFMFSAVLPWTCLLCIVANCFEVVADLFKLCFVTQRPMAQRAKNIGAWKVRLFQRFFLSHQINAFICRIHNASFFFTN
jgi:hypothetical protein